MTASFFIFAVFKIEILFQMIGEVSSIMLHQSGVIVYKNNYLWLNLVYVAALACLCVFCEIIN